MALLFSVDCEEWFQGAGIEQSARRECIAEVERNTNELLELLGNAYTNATFFVLGEVAKRHPSLVRRISEAGHTVASHGTGHEFVYLLTRQQFRDSLRHSKQQLEDATGLAVKGYRAPYFSITKDSLWAFDVLIEEGFEFDCSIAPITNYRYGIACAPTQPFILNTPSGSIKEIPTSRLKLLPSQSLWGGFYFRALPYIGTKPLIEDRRSGHAMFYIHPWELHPIKNSELIESAFLRWRMNFNNKSTRTKLKRLLQEYTFTSIEEVLTSLDSATNQVLVTDLNCSK